jgi:hypothetical protein
MPTAEETSHRFRLQPAALRRQQRSLRVALAWYLTGAMVLTGFAVWSAGQPAGVGATALIALSAAQVGYFASVAVVRLWQVRRDLRRAGTPAGELALDRFNDWVLRPLRYYHLWSLWAIPLMLGPAGAGLFIMHQSLAATFVLVVGCGFAFIEGAKVAMVSRLLRVSRRGLGRLLLTPDYLKLPGTDVPVPWSHVQGATVVRGQRPGLAAVVVCPDPDPVSDCKLRDRRSPFHIAESLYYTTADDIGAAFARYTDVDRSETRPSPG